MKPVFQTHFAPPDGNCLQACLASLFELDLESVPEFQHLYDSQSVPWTHYLDVWLVLHFKVQALWIGIGQEFVPAGFHLIGGKTAKGVEHVVVGFQGKIVHDPIPSGSAGFVPDCYVLFVSTLDFKI